MKCLIMTAIVPLPQQIEQEPKPVLVDIPDNAIPIQIEYRSGNIMIPQPSLAIHYLVPCDDAGNPIEEGIPSAIYESAWLELGKVFGEQSNQEALDIMDSILNGVRLQMEAEAEQKSEQGG